MIFLCVGSREYQFDRLIKEVDQLVEKKVITDKIFGQIGLSNYIPKNFEYKKFLSNDEFIYHQDRANIIISHGGTGSLVGALKKNKQVIAVPRLEKYKEHADDHQLQVTRVLSEAGYLKEVIEIDYLGKAVLDLQSDPISKLFDEPSNIINIIIDFIDENI